MAPERANNSAANEPWLALRSKHQQELHKFQHEVEKSKAELAQKIQAARVKLLDKHKREEEEFWTGKNGRPTQAQNTSESSAPSTTPSAVQSAPKKAQQQPPKSSAASAKAPQPVKPGLSGQALKNPPQSRPTQKKKTSIEVIDLVSDDEDNAPLVQSGAPANGAAQLGQAPASTQTQTHETTTASEAQKLSNIVSARSSLQSETPNFTIPSASLELFGAKSKSYYATPELSRVKREDSTIPGDTRSKQSAFSPSEEQLAVVNTPSKESAPSSGEKQLTVNTNYDNSSSATDLPRTSTAAPQKSSNIFLWQPSPSHPLVYEGYNGTSVQQPTFQAQQALDTAASPARMTPIRDSSAFTGFASWASSQRASTAAPQSEQNADQNLLTAAHDSASRVPNSTVLPDSSHNQRAQDGLRRTSGLATKSPANGSIFFFAENEEATAGDDGDVHMQEAPQTPEAVHFNSNTSESVGSQQRTPRLSHIPLPTDYELRLPASKARASHIPSPPASQVSASEPKTPKTLKTGGTGFKRPNLPASASKVTNARHIRAGSNASSCTIPAPITPRSQGCASVTSTSSARKRKIEIDLSSDEESDFAPASSSDDDYEDDDNHDDEVDSPEGRQRERKKKTKKSQAPAPKRWKPAPSALSKARGSVPFPALNVPLVKGKNKMGFKPVGNANKNTNHRKANKPVPSSSLTRKPAPTITSAATTSSSKNKPNTSTPRFPPPSPSSPESTTLLRFTPRKAALQATEKIHKLRAADEEFWTHESIVEAEEQEERVKARGRGLEAAERVRRGLRRLSITPGPGSSASAAGAGREEDRVEDLMDVESASNVASGIGGVRNETAGASGNTTPAAWSKWTHDRNNGDRFLSKTQPQTQTQSHPRNGKSTATTVDDATSDDDLDISEYTILANNILIRPRRDVEELDLTQST
ncbi:hypothetical protein N0V83_001213 [Neocucurbitaria cava]|uniref:Uncharacterized protein n=1 Tax=Neocucurbitaria cava TaxID=798079 RepID=A0A9W8YFN3_9PLEO|nr:hypothetical protein N0V83_001213 [Neocucurbitaria cava]